MNGLTKYWFLEGFNLFKKLDRTTMMGICKMLKMTNIDKGARITLTKRTKKSIFFLIKGAAKIVNTSNNQVKYLVKHGDIFGELALYDAETTENDVAFALEDCIICHIDSERMEALIDKNKTLKTGILKIYGSKIKTLESRLYNLLLKDSPDRIKDFTIEYLKEFGEMDTSGNLVAKNLLSHKDIANLTNTSRQTVSNVMSSLRKKGLIFYDSQTISIPAIHSLNVINEQTSQLVN